MIDKKSAQGRDSCQKRQKSGPSLKPSLVPKHESILPDRLQKYFAQSNVGNLDRAGIHIVGARSHFLSNAAHKQAHLTAVGTDSLDTRNLKLTLGWRERKDQINAPVQFTE